MLSRNPPKRPISAFRSNRTDSNPPKLREPAFQDSNVIKPLDAARSPFSFNDLNSTEPSVNFVDREDGEVTPEPKRIRIFKQEPMTPPNGLPIISTFDLRLPTPEAQTFGGHDSVRTAGRSIQSISFLFYVCSIKNIPCSSALIRDWMC